MPRRGVDNPKPPAEVTNTLKYLHGVRAGRISKTICPDGFPLRVSASFFLHCTFAYT